MNKIKKGDEVIVLCGRDKGRRGVVQRVIRDATGKPGRLIVEGIQMVTHFDRPDPRENKPGGMVKREASLHASNVALLDEEGRPRRVKIQMNEEGKKTRFLSSGQEVK